MSVPGIEQADRKGSILSERPSITERYSRANNSSDLTVKESVRGDADVLIAAGLAPGQLGHALMRLHGEWDASAKPSLITQTDATLLYGRLKSLPRVLGIVAEYLGKHSEASPLKGAKALVMYWLDARCQSCGGLGAHVIAGSPVLGRTCRACGGSKKRQAPLGELGKRTLNMMDDAVDKARRSMKRRLRP